MKIEFNDEQLALLKDVLDEYAELCYHDMFDYQHAALDTEDERIRAEYNACAAEEEAHFRAVKALSEYVCKYEELMRGV